MASKFVHSGLFFLTVCLILCTIALIAPYWMVNPNIQENTGLYAMCSGTRHRCYWFFEDDFAWQKARDGWHKSCQGLYTAGLAILYVAMLIACLLSCSITSDDNLWPALVINSMVSLAYLLMGAGIVVFGVKAHEHFNAAMHGTAYLFTWAYFTGISGVLAGFLSGVCYSLERCFTRTKADDGYLRGDVY